jgi:hypothetical protein
VEWMIFCHRPGIACTIKCNALGEPIQKANGTGVHVLPYRINGSHQAKSYEGASAAVQCNHMLAYITRVFSTVFHGPNI